MQNVSKLYNDISMGNHWKEYRLAIGDTGFLATEFGEYIAFGDALISVGTPSPEFSYDESSIVFMKTKNNVFSGNGPMIGACVAGEISVTILNPNKEIPQRAQLVPFVRITDGVRRSEWLQKGEYFVDTRTESGTDNKILKLHGYDKMLMAEEDFPSSTAEWPRKDIDVVHDIAEEMGVSVDSHTITVMNKGYLIPYPAGYSQREVLGYIAAMYAGNFIMSDLGELRLLRFEDVPKETSLLIDEAGNRIIFGGVRIRV